jgi:hypothetical protein
MTDDTTPEGGQRDEKTDADAPVWYSDREAHAWASGYNKAVTAQSSRLRSLEQRLRDLEGKWRKEQQYYEAWLPGADPTYWGGKAQGIRKCADDLSTLIDQG